LRAADGDVVVAARTLRMSTRDILQVLLSLPQTIPPTSVGDDGPAWIDDE
jgi:hypothetical protein